MGAKSEALAKQFEAKARDAMVTLERLSDADWKKVTAAEKWSVGVTAHHIAGVFEQLANVVVKTIAAGRAPDGFSLDRIDEMNAQHAKDYAACTRAETIELHKRGVAAALATIHGLSDEELARSASLAPDAPPMTVEQIIIGGLLNHVDDHFGSIRKTIG